ncbi:MAG: TetR/AcrR family transcriptional regulator, partial [Janthinobacterium sp.]
MVALGCMSAPTAEHAAVAAPLTASRTRTRAGFAHCVERGMVSGELSAQTDGLALAAVFDGFLSGVSIQARDGVGYAVFDAAITHILRVWDANRSGA